MTGQGDFEATEKLFDFESGSPVRGSASSDVEDGYALALSGGGYRAMLFHVGVILRINEVGLLGRLKRISSVSGGSITSGVLATRWTQLDWDGEVATNLSELLEGPIRRLASTRIDIPSVVTALAMPFVSVADRVQAQLDETLFDGATLADLPTEPQFVFNATNLESGILFRFRRDYLGDYRVGRVFSPVTPVSAAVTASAAFPPFLSPYQFGGEGLDWRTERGNDLTGDDYRGQISLSDGGVYDNLALEAVWKRYRTILISDAGGHFEADDHPDRDWLRQMLRVLHIMDSQVRALRRRMVIDAFKSGKRHGIFVSTISRLDKFPNGPHIPVNPKVTDNLANLSTRLWPIDPSDQERLINWGYAATDAGIRGFLQNDSPSAPGSLPHPTHPLV